MPEGFFSGYGAGQHDYLAGEETLGRIAMQPAHQRIYEAEAGTKEMQLRQAQRMEQLMQGFDWGAPGGGGAPGGAPGGQPQSMATPYWRMAEIAGRSGNVEQSRKLAAGASQIMVRESNALNARSSMESRYLNMQFKNMGALEGILSGAKDQASFDAGNMMYEMQYQRPSPYRGMVYSPELVKSMTDSLIPAKDRVHNQILQNEYGSRADLRNRRINYMDYMQDHLDAMEEIARGREARLAKTGVSKPLAAPTKAETDAALALVKTQMYPSLAGDKSDPVYLQTLETINAGAKDVAASAKAKLRDNPALDWNTALQRALTESIQAGDWQKVAAGGFFSRQPRTAFSGGGKTAETAIPIPPGASAADVRKKMQPGKFYLDPRTNQPIGQWTGTGFSPLAAPAGAGGADDGGDENGDNTDEED